MGLHGRDQKCVVVQEARLLTEPRGRVQPSRINGQNSNVEEPNLLNGLFLDLFGLSSNALFTMNRGVDTILNDDRVSSQKPPKV
jgi:hypothetical protein